MGARITWLTRHALSAAWGENSMESVADETWLCQPELDRLFAGLVMLLNVGCNMKSGLASSPRTPYWQLLLTQSLFRSLEEAAIPLRQGDSVAVEVAWCPSHDDFSADRLYAQAVLQSWLARRDAVVDGDSPAYCVRVLMQAFGVKTTGYPFRNSPNSKRTLFHLRTRTDTLLECTRSGGIRV